MRNLTAQVEQVSKDDPEPRQREIRILAALPTPASSPRRAVGVSVSEQKRWARETPVTSAK